ncbi:D-alanyl-lipoteichoic acid biosynthesis protein DltB [Streptococcus hongkongensis]|nr:D-alanyl-lipoteichoic acid biosynthesis protein [Streptococcus uberis]
MIRFLESIPYLEPYANPQYFIFLLLLLIPIIIGIFKGKRFPIYEFIISVLFIAFMFGENHYHQLFAFILYIIWQSICVFTYKAYRKEHNNTFIFYLASFLVIFPLLCVKIVPILAFDEHQSLFAFLGISYLTFKSVGMIIEMRDGTLKDFTFLSFLRFIIFLPTFSSGPIDRYRRFNEDYLTIPNQDDYFKMLEKAINYIMLGFLYKFIISHVLGNILLPLVQVQALKVGTVFSLSTLYVMYGYGLNLFFDFAGYSMFAIGISYIMGIRTPENFNKPFLSPNLKEFWNRWHMSLSFWFRDFVFMRLVHHFFKKKTFKNRNMTSNVAYLVNMLIMGFWHGITWYYIAYGLFHGIGLILTDIWLRKKKEINRNRKKRGLKPLFESKLFHVFSIVFTFHIVMISLLIFSGFLNDLWFPTIQK